MRGGVPRCHVGDGPSGIMCPTRIWDPDLMHKLTIYDNSFSKRAVNNLTDRIWPVPTAEFNFHSVAVQHFSRGLGFVTKRLAVSDG